MAGGQTLCVVVYYAMSHTSIPYKLLFAYIFLWFLALVSHIILIYWTITAMLPMFFSGGGGGGGRNIKFSIR